MAWRRASGLSGAAWCKLTWGCLLWCACAATLPAADKAAKPVRAAVTDKPVTEKAVTEKAAAEGSQPAEPAAADSSPVVATVDGEPIRLAEVESALAPVVAGRKLSPDALATLQAAALDQLVERSLVEHLLSAGGKGVKPADVEATMAKLMTQLEAKKSTLEQFLATRGQTPAEFRRQIAWQMLWERAMQMNLNDKTLEAYFAAHRKEFDGSEVRASHILLRPAKAGDPDATAKLVKEVAALRAQIEAGKISFADAAARYSAGPSREKGGDVGFFPRHGLMVEPFSQAAFALDKGQISQPVVTPFGVHLIQATDVAPGKKKWTDVREQLKPPAAQALFDRLANRQRDKAKIEFSGNWPHFKPGTREVIPPAPAGK